MKNRVLILLVSTIFSVQASAECLSGKFVLEDGEHRFVCEKIAEEPSFLGQAFTKVSEYGAQFYLKGKDFVVNNPEATVIGAVFVANILFTVFSRPANQAELQINPQLIKSGKSLASESPARPSK